METIEEIDEQFPELTTESIIGIEREERNEKITTIFNEIKEEIAEVKKEHPKLV